VRILPRIGHFFEKVSLQATRTGYPRRLPVEADSKSAHSGFSRLSARCGILTRFPRRKPTVQRGAQNCDRVATAFVAE
jgi:hypothetical protein